MLWDTGAKHGCAIRKAFALLSVWACVAESFPTIDKMNVQRGGKTSKFAILQQP